METVAAFRSVTRGFENNLARQFMLVATFVLLVGMLAQGLWVTRKIEEGVTDVAAASAALHVNGFIAPHILELRDGDSLSPAAIDSLNQALQSMMVRSQISMVNIWKRGGLIAYSSQPDLIGRRFPDNPNPSRAWKGEVVTVFDDLIYEEDAQERSRGKTVMEVFAPIRDFASGEVIAVLEFHEQADRLEAELTQAQWHSWAVQGLITASMLGALFSIVFDASKTIDRQRIALADRVRQLSDLLHQNEALRYKVERAAQNAAENLERGVRRIGYDLHDGIAQLIGTALLRIDHVKGADPDSSDNIARIQSILGDALKDVRNLCKGLLLPEIQSLGLKDALGHMVTTHERTTGSTVQASLGALPEKVPDYVKASLCRFLQEALNNSYRHAKGMGLRVSAATDDSMVVLSVSDDGPGMSFSPKQSEARFGLKSLMDRIESVGGHMSIESRPGLGTSITASLPLTKWTGDER
ncbi:sensor histidine kinase [Microvirga pudoricolor]|uniref:sensor histidine kinase n=1 Tax=Microvirga pudoricolor TaxID=2778729 RepID=UPI00195147F1|nr:sensor histidine kinase [Microvirga pudoricolor]MBM6596401.1 sensor histidine kinase [Microvirga pudoricolor]